MNKNEINVGRRDVLKLSTLGGALVAAGCASSRQDNRRLGSVFVAYKGNFLSTPDKVFNVLEYGARGDGITLDTDAIQAAIDACSKAGGGTVWVPAGDYHIGTIELKSYTTLSLDYGAHLLGSQNLADYRKDLVWPREDNQMCLIYAYRQERIVIEGLGMIDGRGTSDVFPRSSSTRKYIPRPRLLRFQECTDVSFSGVTYKRTAFWGLHLIDCLRVHFNGVVVRFANNHFNNDALDIDGCTDVLIENCDIESGDDAICLKSSGYHPCKNVLVRSCRVSSHTAPLKFGTSSQGGFVNVKVTNCYFYDSPMGAIKLLAVDGGIIDQIEISRIVMENVGNPIFIRLGNRGRIYDLNMGDQLYDKKAKPEGRPVGQVGNIYIHDVVAKVTGDRKKDSGPIMIAGIPGHAVKGVVLKNIDISFPGGGTTEDAKRIVPEDIARYPEQKFFGILPAWGAYIRHAEDIHFDNVTLTLRHSDARPKFYLEDAKGFKDD